MVSQERRRTSRARAGSPPPSRGQALPRSRHILQHLGRVLADLAQRAAAAARPRHRMHNALARRCAGNSRRAGRLRSKPSTLTLGSRPEGRFLAAAAAAAGSSACTWACDAFFSGEEHACAENRLGYFSTGREAAAPIVEMPDVCHTKKAPREISVGAVRAKGLDCASQRELASDANFPDRRA